MNGPLKEETGVVIMCDHVFLGVLLTSSLLSCDQSIFLVDETSGKGIYDY